MQEEMRLPRNAKEGLLFGVVISALSASLIGGSIMIIELGWSIDTLKMMLVGIPCVWILALLFNLFILGRISSRIQNMFLAPTDSVNARLLANLVICVTIMSVLFTFIGTFVGSIASIPFGGSVDIVQCLKNWPHAWPRNFCIAFFIEMCIAQPAARAVMTQIHKKQSSTKNIA